MTTFKTILSRFLLFWLCLACVVAFFWAPTFGDDAFNPFFLNANQMAALIAVTMFAVGSLLPYDEVKSVAKQWPKILGGTCVQYLAMPTLAFCVAKIFHLEGPYFIGIMMAGCVPGAMASNVLTLTARGNVSYSVGLTTSATLLSPLVVPATLCFFFKGSSFEIDFASIMLNLLLTVVAPVAVGFTLARLFQWWQKGAERFAEIIANLVIIWIIAAVVARNADNVAKMTAVMLLAVVMLNFLGFLAGYFGGTALRITPAMRRALTIEVGMQNAGLGTALATRYFADQPEAALFCASYTFECMAAGVVLAQIFRICVERDAKNAEKNAPQTQNQNVDSPQA